jgi:RNA polymerase sigma-70 factor (ECF subfamily)
MDDGTPDPAVTEDILRRLDQGGRAHDDLVAHFRDYLRRFVERRLDPCLRGRVGVSDVVQDTWVTALQRLEEYLERRPMPFHLWLRNTALERVFDLWRFHVTTRRRSLKREVPVPDGSALQLARSLVAPGSTPGQRLDRAEAARRVRLALGRLPEGDRRVLLMRNFEGMSNQEIGFVLDTDPATVSKRYGRALLRLRKILEESGLTELPS